MNVMKRQQTAPSLVKPTFKTLFASLTIIAFWGLFWLGSQALFMVDIPLLTPWLLSADPQTNFLSVGLWILGVNLLALAVYHVGIRDYSFLKVKNKWDILAYILPLGLTALLLFSKQAAFGVPILLYIAVMIATNFCQELLTTGFMQTGLARNIGGVWAALVTTMMFYLGHFMIQDTFTLMGLVMIAGFILFSWLRLKRGNLYLANVVHLSWALAMVMLA
jgi:membrane protease YdiL (CAAX protease family)